MEPCTPNPQRSANWNVSELLSAQLGAANVTESVITRSQHLARQGYGTLATLCRPRTNTVGA